MKKLLIACLAQTAIMAGFLGQSPRAEAQVTWHGGPGLPNVQVENLYLGSNWNTEGGRDWAAKLDKYTGYLVKSPFMDALKNAGYGVGRGEAYEGKILTYNLNSKEWLYDQSIRNAIQNAINKNALQPDANCLYVVYVEANVAVVSPNGQVSTKDFFGYHSYFAGKDAAGRKATIPYAVIMLPGGPNMTSQGFPSDFARVTSTASHEIAEAVTDPLMNGWFAGNQEIGDLADGNYQYLNGYYVQLIAGKNTKPMRLTKDRIYGTGDWR